jgi:hypothetical protein
MENSRLGKLRNWLKVSLKHQEMKAHLTIQPSGTAKWVESKFQETK